MATVGPSATTLAGILARRGMQSKKFFKFSANNFIIISFCQYIFQKSRTISIIYNYIHAEDAHEKLTF